MKKNRICEYLDSLFPEPKCELLYQKDYELLMAIVLSAQSTDKRVNMVTPVMFHKYPSLEALKEAPLEDLEDIIHSVGSFRKKASYIKQIAQILINSYNGIVPKNREVLMRFPGVGRKTANVFLSEYYDIPAIAVDTHVERISKRLGMVSWDDDVLKVEEQLMQIFPKKEWSKRHLQMVLFGRYYCKAIKPECSTCLLQDICFRNENDG